MDIKEFSEYLKQRREKKRISLMDIALETRINISFLESLEAGKLPSMPHTYIRAFLREYARIVELDPEEVVGHFQEVIRGSQPPVHKSVSHETAETQEVPVEEEPLKKTKKLTSNRNFVFGVIVVVCAVITVYLFYSVSNQRAGVEEVPFSSVVQEQQPTEPASGKADSVSVSTRIKPDSLYLEMSAQDTVWVSVTSDKMRTDETIIPPGRKRRWAASNQFSVTLGNAGGGTFTLNGKPIGALGKRGMVVRNVIINSATLENK